MGINETKLKMAKLRGKLEALQESQDTLRLREHEIRTELQHLQIKLDKEAAIS